MRSGGGLGAATAVRAAPTATAPRLGRRPLLAGGGRHGSLGGGGRVGGTPSARAPARTALAGRLLALGLAARAGGGTAPPAAVTGTVLLAGLAEVLELLGCQALAGALRTRQPPGRLLGDVQVGPDPRRGGVGLGRLLEVQAQVLVDQLPAGDVVPVDQRDRDAVGTGPAGAADPVQVGLLVLG